MTTDRIERFFTAATSVAAIVLAAIAVKQQLAPRAAIRASNVGPPTAFAAWKDAYPVGIRVGDSTARVTIVVFDDLECPGCRTFHRTVRRVLKEHPQDVSVVFVHFPLTSHRFALPAARAAECANQRGRFASFIDVVFAKQDSLGIKSWGSYAQEAGVRDTAVVSACARGADAVDRIEAGRALGMRWEIQSTPTVIINGQRYSTQPSGGEVDSLIKRALSQ